MTFDPLLLALAPPMKDAYNLVPAWENASKTAHVVRGVVDNINAYFWLGTEDLKEWVLDDFDPILLSDGDCPDIGWVQRASVDNVNQILPQIIANQESLGWPPYYFVGHSKGAREAPLAHALMKHRGHPPLATRIYEPPRVGGDKLAEYLATENILGTQTYNNRGDDTITLVPYGIGWSNCCHIVRLQVSNSYGVRDKHVMSPGVLSGLGLQT